MLPVEVEEETESETEDFKQLELRPWPVNHDMEKNDIIFYSTICGVEFLAIILLFCIRRMRALNVVTKE